MLRDTEAGGRRGRTAGDQTPPVSLRAALRAIGTSVERVRLGDRHVLRSTISGAIVTTDDLGLKILAEPCPPSEVSTVPPALVDEVLRVWETAGLLAAGHLPFPDPVTDDGRAASCHRDYSTDWGAISIATDDPVLASQLDDLLWAFVSPAGKPADGEVLRCIGCTGGGLGVFRGGRALWGRASIDAARYLIVREAAEALCGVDRAGAVLHGAAVLGRRGALVILGDSGRGKSTLAQGLIDAGCGFLADDHLPLHADGRRLLTFPTGSAIKAGARDLDEVRRLIARYGDRDSSRHGISYAPFDPAAAPGAAISVAAIVFPHHARGATLRMQQMDPEAALAAAIASGSRPSRHRSQIAPLVHLFAAVPSYELHYGTSAQSVPICLDLLAK